MPLVMSSLILLSDVSEDSSLVMIVVAALITGISTMFFGAFMGCRITDAFEKKQFQAQEERRLWDE